MTASKLETRTIVMLARNDMREAMRIASGLTIFGHSVSLVFMHRALTDEEANSEQAELLELADIVPVTTVQAMQEYFEHYDQSALGKLIHSADIVLNA